MLKCLILGVCACGYLGWKVLGRYFAPRSGVAEVVQQPRADYLAAAKQPETRVEIGSPELDHGQAPELAQGGGGEAPGEHFFDCKVEHDPADLESAAAAG